MRGRRFPFQLLALTLVLGCVALPTSLQASGFQLIEQNASGLGNAYAGQAAGVKNATAIFFNPAALTRSEGWSFVASVEPIGIGTTFANTASQGPSAGAFTFPVPLGTEGGDAGGWIPVPNGYLSGKVAKRVWVGVGFNVPFGLETSWPTDWMGRFHATKSKVQAMNVNPTLAIQVTDRLSIGAGADFQHLTADLGQGVAFGGLAYAGTAQAVASQPAAVQAAALGAVVSQLGPSGRALEGSALISGDSNAWGFNVGALLKLTDEAHLGVSYRSRVKHDVTGTVEFSGAPTFSLPGALAPIGNGLNARFANGPVTTAIELPETLSVAMSWERDRVELLADWTYTGWDSIGSLDINRADGSALNSVPLEFANTWRVGLGGNVKLGDKWKLRLGTAYDKAPVQDEFRTPRLPDNDRVWAAAGAEWILSKKARVDVGYAHLFIGDASSNLPNQATTTSTPVGALVGNYSAKVDILGAQLTLTF